MIGINTKIFSRTGAYQGLGFAIPSNIVVQIASELIKYGKIRSGWIGNFRVAPIRIILENKFVNGLRIVEIDNYGPLFEKGVKINDIIIKINDDQSNWNTLTSSLKFASLGNDIKFNVLTSDNKSKIIIISSKEIMELAR